MKEQEKREYKKATRLEKCVKEHFPNLVYKQKRLPEKLLQSSPTNIWMILTEVGSKDDAENDEIII